VVVVVVPSYSSRSSRCSESARQHSTPAPAAAISYRNPQRQIAFVRAIQQSQLFFFFGVFTKEVHFVVDQATAVAARAAVAVVRVSSALVAAALVVVGRLKRRTAAAAAPYQNSGPLQSRRNRRRRRRCGCNGGGASMEMLSGPVVATTMLMLRRSYSLHLFRRRDQLAIL